MTSDSDLPVESNPAVNPAETSATDSAAAAADLTAPAPEPLRPSEGGERIEIIDIVRGLALFGILAANMRGFAGPAIVYFSPEKFWPGLSDRLAQAFIDTFIQGKFITIFAFLFGVGFTVQLSRAQERGARFGWLYARRLFVLILFGLVHGLLIWFGDILLVYALTGFLLLFFRKRKDKTVLIWGIICYFVPLLLMVTIYVVSTMVGKMPPGPPEPTAEMLQKLQATFADGSWIEINAQRMRDAVGFNWGFFPFFFPHVLGLFLFGVLAWRRRFFQPTPESLPKYRRAMQWGLTLGVIGNVAATTLRWIVPQPPFPPTPISLFVGVLQNLTIPALSLGYVCAVILLCHDPVWKARLARFGAIGRTALSNYLLQSIIGTLLFYNYGLGLFGVGPALLLIPTVGIYVFQAVLSPWWLERYRFGPAEWLWRSLTYGRMQPMVRERSAPVHPEATAA